MSDEKEDGRERDPFFAIASLFRSAVRLIRKDLALSGLGITFEQSTVLMVLGHHGGLSQQQLAEATEKDRPSITRLIDNMVKRDLVQRVADERDHRINLIHLTEKGRQTRKRIIGRFKSNVQEMLQGIPEGGMQDWFGIMKQLSANCTRLDERLTRRLEQLQLETRLKSFKKSGENETPR